MKWRYLLVAKLLIVSICVYTLLYTTMGLQVILYGLNWLSPGHLQVQNIQGRLSHLQLGDIAYQDDEQKFYLKNLTLSWQPLALLHKHFAIEELTLDDFTWQTIKPSTQGIQWPTWKITLQRALIHRAHLQMQPKTEPIYVQQLQLQHLQLPAKSRAGNLSVMANWQGIQAHLFNSFGDFNSPKGVFTLQGQTDAYRIAVELQMQNQRLNNSTWALYGTGNTRQLNVNQLLAHTLSGQISGQASLTWQPYIQWHAILQGQGLDLNQTWPTGKSKLNFKLRSQGVHSNQLVQGSVDLIDLNGQLNQQSVHGQGHVNWQNQALTLDNLQLDIGSNHLSTHGTLNHSWNLVWQLTIPDLHHLFTDARGQIISHGLLLGTKTLPQINANVRAKQIHWQDFVLADAKAKVTLYPYDNTASQILLDIDQLTWRNHVIGQLLLQGQGLASAHVINLSMSNTHEKFQTQVTGSYTPTHWQGQISQLRWQTRDVGLWQLRHPVPFDWQSDKVSIDNFCLAATQQQYLCLQGKWQTKQGSQAQIHARALPLAFINDWLPKTVKMQGLLNSDVTWQTDQKQLSQTTGTISFQQPGHLSYMLAGQKFTSLLNGSLHFKMAPQDASLCVSLQADPDVNLKAHFTLPNYQARGLPSAQEAIEGQVSLLSKRLDFLPLWFEHLQTTRGEIQADLKVKGQISAPQIFGTVHLRQGSAKIPSLGLSLSDAALQATGDINGEVHFNGQVRSGPGWLKVNGKSSLSHPQTAITAHLTGQNVQILHTPDYEVVASPQLDLQISDHLGKISGTVFIPSAHIHPVAAQTLSASDDITYVDAPKQKSSLPIVSDIQLLLGKQINIDIGGLTGRLQGKLKLHDTATELTTAIGELNIVDGHYQTYGETLNVSQGALYFTGGPIDNPGVNLQTTRSVAVAQSATTPLGNPIGSSNQIVTHLVGVNVRGTLKNPQMNLFAEPADLNQTDILSYLVLGRASSSVSGTDAELLLKTASFLSGTNSTGPLSHLTEQIQRSFGLDELSVQNTPTPGTNANMTQNTSVVLGKALSPRLYVNYSIGIFTPINILKIRYLLSSKWTLETQSSSLSNGIDLFYTLERK